MKYFALIFNLNSGISQPELMDQLKTEGFDAIQFSGGLYAKGAKVPKIKGVIVKSLDRERILKDPKVAQDLRAFLD